MRDRPAMQRHLIAGLIAAAVGLPAQALTIDPFLTLDDVSSSPVRPYRAERVRDEDAEAKDPCAFGEMPKVLSLADVVERSLCKDPQTRQAWANAKYQAAVVGIRQGAYLPTLTAVLNASKQRNVTEYDSTDLAKYNSNAKPTVYSGSLKLSMTLLDFNLRSANVKQAKALLEAANLAHDSAIQAAFLRATQAYFDALAARGVYEAMLEIEKLARDSLRVADALVKGGVASLTDKLQASTAYAQSRLDRVSAEAEYRNALGNIAIALGLPATTELKLQAADGMPRNVKFLKPADDLLAEAVSVHPRLLSMRAEYEAAQAAVGVAQGEGLPTLALTGEVARNLQEKQLPSVSLPPTDIRGRNYSLGVQLNVPIFEGFTRSYKVQSAREQAEAKLAEYGNLERQVMTEVWKSYQALNAETQGLDTTADLLSSARKSFDVARGRYKEGVGNIVELLNVQTTLAKAMQQRYKTLSNWHNARLKLAASVGSIGYWAIEDLVEAEQGDDKSEKTADKAAKKGDDKR